MKRYIGVGIVVLAVFCGSWAIAQSSMGNPKRGQMIYQDFCVGCHGEKLDGHGPEAQYLRVQPANLQSLSSRVKSDWELLVILSSGVMFTPMHGYRDLLNEQEMRDVLSYVRMVAPFKAIG
jgi:mono/diheme cytochrome c family protein